MFRVTFLLAAILSRFRFSRLHALWLLNTAKALLQMLQDCISVWKQSHVTLAALFLFLISGLTLAQQWLNGKRGWQSKSTGSTCQFESMECAILTVSLLIYLNCTKNTSAIQICKVQQLMKQATGMRRILLLFCFDDKEVLVTSILHPV